MKAPNKMMIAVGALALTATTLLAGCGGSSTEATPAAEPAAAKAPESIFEGTVKPADISDTDWESIVMASDEDFLQKIANATPEQIAKSCADGAGDTDAAAAAENSVALGGTLEEWTQVWEIVLPNMVLVACSMAE